MHGNAVFLGVCAIPLQGHSLQSSKGGLGFSVELKAVVFISMLLIGSTVLPIFGDHTFEKSKVVKN